LFLVLVVGVLIFNTYCFRTHGTYKNIYKAYKDLYQQKIELLYIYPPEGHKELKNNS
jgi:hypothetical protein